MNLTKLSGDASAFSSCGLFRRRGGGGIPVSTICVVGETVNSSIGFSDSISVHRLRKIFASTMFPCVSNTYKRGVSIYPRSIACFTLVNQKLEDCHCFFVFSRLRFGSSVRYCWFVESRGLPRMHDCNLYFFAGLANFKISRFGGFGSWDRILFTKFDNPKQGLKRLTFEVLRELLTYPPSQNGVKHAG